MKFNHSNRLAMLGIVLLIGTACTQAAPPAPTVAQEGSSVRAATAVPAPRILTLGVQREPASFEPELIGAAASSAAGGGLQYRPIAQDDLTVPGPGGDYQARLAVEMPTVEKGTWRLNADG